MSGEQFTIEDAENDGKIKREVGPSMQRVASREYGQLYEMFANVCGEKGMEPKTVLADGVLRAIKNQEFSEMVAQVDIDMSSLKKGNLRIDDAKMLKRFSEELGLDADDGDDWLEDTVRDRIQSSASTPLSHISERRRNKDGGDVDPAVAEEISRLSQQVDRLSRQIEEGGSSSQSEPDEDGKSVDELFGGDGDSPDDDGADENDDVVVEENGDGDETDDDGENVYVDMGIDEGSIEEDEDDDGGIVGSSQGVEDDE